MPEAVTGPHPAAPERIEARRHADLENQETVTGARPDASKRAEGVQVQRMPGVVAGPHPAALLLLKEQSTCRSRECQLQSLDHTLLLLAAFKRAEYRQVERMPEAVAEPRPAASDGAEDMQARITPTQLLDHALLLLTEQKACRSRECQRQLLDCF